MSQTFEQPESNDEEMTVTLDLEDGSSVECAIVTILTVNNQDYIVLLPLDENGENEDTAVVAAAKGLTTLHANTYREAADALLRLMQPGDALLVKASRGMALEKVLELFYKEQQ